MSYPLWFATFWLKGGSSPHYQFPFLQPLVPFGSSLFGYLNPFLDRLGQRENPSRYRETKSRWGRRGLGGLLEPLWDLSFIPQLVSTLMQSRSVYISFDSSLSAIVVSLVCSYVLTSLFSFESLVCLIPVGCLFTNFLISSASCEYANIKA